MQHIEEFIMHPTIKDAQINLRLPAKLKSQIDAYARQTGRSKSFVAVEALSEYLAWRMPQIEDLTLAIKAADQGDFATEEEVNAAFAARINSAGL
jgi:predicted transcriptional regulator